MKKIAIIGSGLSGLTLARGLKNYAKVSVFEKSRGVGGRLATRRIGDFHFDHGAQFFTAKSDEFKDFVSLLLRKNIIERWDARFAEYNGSKIMHKHKWKIEYPHYVGVPSMNAIGKFLSNNLDIKLNTKIVKISSENNNWKIFDDKKNFQGNYDWIIFAIPPKQVIDFIPNKFKYFNEVNDINMLGCYSLLLGYDKQIEFPFDAGLIRGAKISWISINSSKPSRLKNFTMVINSTNKWADENINLPNGHVKDFILNETSNVLNYDLSNAKIIDLQRWKYANIPRQELQKPFIDKKNRLAASGDWCTQGRLEFAYLNSKKIIEKIINFL